MLVSGKSLALVFGSLLVTATFAVLYLPKIGQADQSATEATEHTETKPKLAAEEQTKKNLKKLIMAIHNNAGNRGSLPANAIYDANGKPLLSWRVHVLPFLAEEKLYHEFHLNEPWDSEHNRKLIARMPNVFKNPKLDKPGMTDYLAVVGKECVFDGSSKGLGFQNISDGTSKTIAVVEANVDQAVEWTKPQDWNFDRKEPIKGLGSMWPNGCYAAWVDGSVRCIDFTQPSDAIGIQFTRNGGETKSLQESANRNPGETTAGPEGPAMGPEGGLAPAGPGPASKFPSLEDQKLADVAWKRLGLELEPIGDDDLQRVKALGYDGGVKVVAGSTSPQRAPNEVMVETGDILVGLHVWPTRSVKDVVEVLNRDDLAELNPLKFYVVRSDGGFGGPGPDRVVAGRITVKTGGGNRIGGGQFGNNAPTPLPAILQPTPARPADEPQSSYQFTPPTLNRNTSNDPWGNAKPGTTIPAPTPTISQTFPASALENDPYRLPNDIQPRRAPTESGSVAVNAPPLAPSTTVPRQVLVAENEPTTGAPSAFPTNPFNASPAPIASPAGAGFDKSNLRYDGKTFDTWRTTWKTELSTEKRLEAVKALAAFGRAGYGKEAAEAILDVAGQYDFNFIDSTPEGKLKETVLSELAPEYRPQTLAPYWVPDLAARIEKEPNKWKWLTAHLYSRVRTGDEAVVKILQTVAASGDRQLRREALGALIRSSQTGSDGPQLDEKTRKLIDDALASKDPAVVRSTLQLLVNYPPNSGGGGGGGGGGFGGGSTLPTPQLLYRPAMFPKLLFNSDEDVRRQARGISQILDGKDASQLVDQLLAVLKDKSRKSDHIEAIRGLAALGGKAAKASPELIDILKTSEDQATLAAAMVAVVRCADKPATIDGGGEKKRFNVDVLDEVFSKQLTDEERLDLSKRTGESNEKAEKFNERLIQEDAAILPASSPYLGGGGFF